MTDNSRNIANAMVQVKANVSHVTDSITIYARNKVVKNTAR
jgi:hypothetical protein